MDLYLVVAETQKNINHIQFHVCCISFWRLCTWTSRHFLCCTVISSNIGSNAHKIVYIQAHTFSPTIHVYMYISHAYDTTCTFLTITLHKRTSTYNSTVSNMQMLQCTCICILSTLNTCTSIGWGLLFLTCGWHKPRNQWSSTINTVAVNKKFVWFAFLRC